MEEDKVLARNPYRIWRVDFGHNADKVYVEEYTIDKVLEKVRNNYQDEMKEEPEHYWISGVELIAESDI